MAHKFCACAHVQSGRLSVGHFIFEGEREKDPSCKPTTISHLPFIACSMLRFDSLFDAVSFFLSKGPSQVLILTSRPPMYKKWKLWRVSVRLLSSSLRACLCEVYQSVVMIKMCFNCVLSINTAWSIKWHCKMYFTYMYVSIYVFI